MLTHYVVLGLAPHATQQEIKKAYYDRAKALHPDISPGSKFSEELLKYVNLAYEVLSNNARRKKYDADLIDRWLNELIKTGSVAPIFTPFGKYHRLSSPCQFQIPADKIADLTKHYDPGIEKGGLFLFRIEKKDFSICMVLDEIIYLTNTSKKTNKQFDYDPAEFNCQMDKALLNRKIPCFFHSHPTKALDIINEQYVYYYQMNTSLDDKKATQHAILPATFNLRLPEFLVIANGSLKSGLFVGAYGGLVAPLDFQQRKKEITDSFAEMAFEDISNWLSTPKGKGVGLIALAGLTYLAVKYQKGILPTIRTLGAALPGVVLDDPLKHYFGISNGSELDIIIPPSDDSQILFDESKINFTRSEMRK